MGRTNGKLIPFLRYGLENDMFRNLQYEPDSVIFFIELPRYEKNRPMEQYEHLLREWYKCNGNEEKYGSYSNAKAVFQASLKKSVYLVSEETISKKLRFHFGSPSEIEVKKRRLLEKERKYRGNSSLGILHDSSNESSEGVGETSTVSYKLENLPVSNNFEMDDPPSVKSSSSGYVTGEEVEENASVLQQQSVKFYDGNLEPSLDFLDDLDLFNEVKMDKNYPGLENIQVEDLFKPVDPLSLNNTVEEISVTPVDVSEFVKQKTYWLCNKKLNLDVTLLLICKKQALEEGSQITEGTAVIPNGVWEPGIMYDYKKSFELNENLFLFFSRRV